MKINAKLWKKKQKINSLHLILGMTGKTSATHTKLILDPHNHLYANVGCR